MPDENLAALRRGYEGFNRGDASVPIAVSTPDVEWGSTGAFPGVAGLYRGPEAIQEWMDLLRTEWEEFEVGLDEVLHQQDEVLVVSERLRGRGRESGAEVEMCVFAAYWFEGGKVRRRAAFTDREAALAAVERSE